MSDQRKNTGVSKRKAKTAGTIGAQRLTTEQAQTAHFLALANRHVAEEARVARRRLAGG